MLVAGTALAGYAIEASDGHGNTGAVHAGKLNVVTERPEAALKAIAGWRLATAA